ACKRRRGGRRGGRRESAGHGERQEQRPRDAPRRARARWRAGGGALFCWLVRIVAICWALFQGGCRQSGGNKAPCARAWHVGSPPPARGERRDLFASR